MNYESNLGMPKLFFPGGWGLKEINFVVIYNFSVSIILALNIHLFCL